MTEQELLVDCLRRLNGAAITYYLTGSMASNYWGIPRSTHDLDFVIQLPPSTIEKLVSAFSPDFYVDDVAVRAAYQPPHQFNAIDTRSALKVDFWLSRPDVFEQEMLRRRLRVTLFDEPAWITTAEGFRFAQARVEPDHAFGSPTWRRCRSGRNSTRESRWCIPEKMGWTTRRFCRTRRAVERTDKAKTHLNSGLPRAVLSSCFFTCAAQGARTWETDP
jgi:hypothetical protein